MASTRLAPGTIGSSYALSSSRGVLISGSLVRLGLGLVTPTLIVMLALPTPTPNPDPEPNPHQSRGDFILVGDLMKSVSLLQCTAASGELKELSRDFNANWMTAVSFLDDDTFLGAENWYNLFTTRKNAEAATDEDRQRLEVVGELTLTLTLTLT